MAFPNMQPVPSLVPEINSIGGMLQQFMANRHQLELERLQQQRIDIAEQRAEQQAIRDENARQYQMRMAGAAESRAATAEAAQTRLANLDANRRKFEILKQLEPDFPLGAETVQRKAAMIGAPFKFTQVPVGEPAPSPQTAISPGGAPPTEEQIAKAKEEQTRRRNVAFDITDIETGQVISRYNRDEEIKAAQVAAQKEAMPYRQQGEVFLQKAAEATNPADKRRFGNIAQLSEHIFQDATATGRVNRDAVKLLAQMISGADVNETRIEAARISAEARKRKGGGVMSPERREKAMEEAEKRTTSIVNSRESRFWRGADVQQIGRVTRALDEALMNMQKRAGVEDVHSAMSEMDALLATVRATTGGATGIAQLEHEVQKGMGLKGRIEQWIRSHGPGGLSEDLKQQIRESGKRIKEALTVTVKGIADAHATFWRGEEGHATTWTKGTMDKVNAEHAAIRRLFRLGAGEPLFSDKELGRPEPKVPPGGAPSPGVAPKAGKTLNDIERELGL